MTVDFAVMRGVDLGALKPDSKIVFTLARGEDGIVVIDEIESSE